MTNPLANNRLTTRADLQRAVLELFEPLKAHFSAGAARVQLGHTGALFDEHAAELEGFARPLWGLVPFAAGGAVFDDWELYRRGLRNGTNPQHPEYWGKPNDRDQRLVEMAAIGLALLMLPSEIWQPLSAEAQSALVTWLSYINTVEIVDSNWLWFRILVNMGLKNVGMPYDAVAMTSALDRIDDFYLGGGWYSDGMTSQRDYYIPFAMHYYGLLYAKFAAHDDPERAQKYRERATEFAQDFMHWFAANGAALPFGRSLSYRFAQGAFWGALAFADLEALPWGQTKGLALRHLRWWTQQPIFSPDGTLSIGYAYPNLNMAEQYNSPNSPYWAMKFFLPLALPASHPFWQAEEQALPEMPLLAYQAEPKMLFYRDRNSRHLVALTSGQSEPWIRHAGEKYAKFAYSTAFAFSIPTGRRGLNQTAADSMLAISDDGEFYRVRERTLEAEYINGALYSRWQALPDLEVETWLIPSPPWHIRVHLFQAKRQIWTAEGGFALNRSGDNPIEQAGHIELAKAYALARYPAGISGIRELIGNREAQVLRLDPNTNLVAPRTVLPTLFAKHATGKHVLAAAILAEPTLDHWQEAWEAVPELPQFIQDRIERFAHEP